MDLIFSTDTLASLVTLTAMEIVLGIDNIVFIAIICGKLPKEKQAKARFLGLILALVFRVALLSLIAWLASLNRTLFYIFNLDLSGRDLILLLGGLFLIYKSTREIFEKLEDLPEKGEKKQSSVSFSSVIGQIIIIDVIFSIDSIITAIGLVEQVSIMIVAVILSLVVMLLFSGKISGFIEKHPSLKLLALSFLLMIGTLLVAEAFDIHVPKSYVYFAMAFSLTVEMLNVYYRKKIKPN